MQLSLVLRSSQAMEQAQQRLRSRFLARWPAGQMRENLAVNYPGTMAQPVVASTQHMEDARQRLSARFLNRWPEAASNGDVAIARAQAASMQTTIAPAETVDHLEAARQRLRSRFTAKFMATNTAAVEAPAEVAFEAVETPGLDIDLGLGRIASWAHSFHQEAWSSKFHEGSIRGAVPLF